MHNFTKFIWVLLSETHSGNHWFSDTHTDKSYLHFLQGLHVDAAAFALLHEVRVKGVHQDDSSQAGSLLPLHILQKHPSFLHFVADDCGDVGCNEISTQEHTLPCVNIIKVRDKKGTRTNAELEISRILVTFLVYRGLQRIWDDQSIKIISFLHFMIIIWAVV